jgi:DNA-binding beta-propeller fold protein YncE
VSVLNGLSDQVTATVTVGGDPVGAAYDSFTNAVYVTNPDDNSVSVIGYPAPS